MCARYAGRNGSFEIGVSEISNFGIKGFVSLKVLFPRNLMQRFVLLSERKYCMLSCMQVTRNLAVKKFNM